MSRQVAALVIVTVPDGITDDDTLDRIEDACERAQLAGVYVEPYIGPVVIKPGETTPLAVPDENGTPAELDWMPTPAADEHFNDQQADLPGGYWAEIGPDYRGYWTWVILRIDDTDHVQDVAGGSVPGTDDAAEAAAKAAVQHWSQTEREKA